MALSCFWRWIECVAVADSWVGLVKLCTRLLCKGKWRPLRNLYKQSCGGSGGVGVDV